ncbi:caspase family protein [Streptomyces sp. NPDC017673]|uniref:caspase family protein n=1 Tax=unclassified Streptomyces TaxID=2593676 RepID=UPI00378A41AE
MAQAVYALLVGINKYQGPFKTLDGCVDDVLAFETFLRGVVPDDLLHVRVLLDEQATRQAVIDGYTTHLSQAGAQDVALFYFAGHGSQEPVEERFWYLEPTGWNQTLVCTDSRLPGIPELADKELNTLVSTVAATGAHVLNILDCCHAGGATRDPETQIRSAPPAAAPRPFEQYLPALQAAWAATARDGGGAEDTAATAAGPPPQVTLSACESRQEAREVVIDGQVRGVFSVMLQRALTRLGPAATYRDLLGATAVSVRDWVLRQEPVGYAMPAQALDEPLFGGAVRLRERGISLEHYRGQWWIDAGAVHGIQPPDGDDTVVLAVLPPDEGADEPARAPLGRVRVTDVQSARSRVTVEPSDWRPDPETRYPTVVVDVPLPQAAVEVRGDSPGAALVRAAVAASPHLVEGAADPRLRDDRFVVRAGSASGGAGPHLVVTRPDGTPLADPVPATTDGAATVVRRLEHLARWQLIKRLDNPGSWIAGLVRVEIVPAEPGETAPPAPGTRASLAAGADGRIRLHYRKTGSAWQRPYVWIYLHNDSPYDLYCTLLDLTDRYRCHSLLFPGDLLPAGSTAVAYDGRPVDVSLPAERLGVPGSEVFDHLKLVASEQRFSADAFELPTLDGAPTRRTRGRAGSHPSLFDRLGGRVVTRDLGALGTDAPEWTTALVTLRTCGPTDTGEEAGG